MFCCPEAMNEEELVQRLREEFEYTKEEIAFELKRIKKIIKERNLTSTEDIEFTYGEMFASITVDKYYKSQEPDYFDKLAEQVQKEIETELKQ